MRWAPWLTFASACATASMAQETVVNFINGEHIVVNGSVTGAISALSPASTRDELYQDFANKHPGINVTCKIWGNGETYKNAVKDRVPLRDFFGPDLFEWWAGPSAVNLAEDLYDLRPVFAELGLEKVLDPGAIKSCESEDGRVVCAPFKSYPWWVVYNRNVFAKHGVVPAETFDELLQLCLDLRAAGVVPIGLGSKWFWTASALFDILDMRTNGGSFHSDLASGKIPFTDRRVVKTFENWQRMKDARCFLDDAHELDLWDEAFKQMNREERIGMMYIGDFYRAEQWAVDAPGGLSSLDVFAFPTIDPIADRGEMIPADAVMIRRSSQQIRPASQLLDYYLSLDYWNTISTGDGVFFTARTDAPQNPGALEEKGRAMLSNTVVRFTAFDLVVPPKFFEAVRQPLVDWIDGRETLLPDGRKVNFTIETLSEHFENARQNHMEGRNSPPVISPPPGTFVDQVVEITLGHPDGTLDSASSPLRMFYSINDADAYAEYEGPIILRGVGEYTIRGKVEGKRLAPSLVTKHTYVISATPPSSEDTNQKLLVCVALLGSAFVAGVSLLIGWVVCKTLRAFKERRELSEQKQVADKQEVRRALKSFGELSFPMSLTDAATFMSLGALTPFEELRDGGLTVILDSLKQVAAFQVTKTIIFLSHQWLSWSKPDPENHHYIAARRAVTSLIGCLPGKETEKRLATQDTFIWVDYQSIPQANMAQLMMAVDTLVTYSSICDVFVAIVPAVMHADTLSVCDYSTYRTRGWCRAELLSKVCGSGTKNMFMADSMDGELKPVGWESLDVGALQVFHGDFTCCARKHHGMKGCDKEKLMNTCLGLFMNMLTAKHSDDVRLSKSGTSVDQESIERALVFQQIIDQAFAFFPATHTYTQLADAGEAVNERELFGERISMCFQVAREEIDSGHISLKDSLDSRDSALAEAVTRKLEQLGKKRSVCDDLMKQGSYPPDGGCESGIQKFENWLNGVWPPSIRKGECSTIDERRQGGHPHIDSLNQSMNDGFDCHAPGGNDLEPYALRCSDELV